MICKLYTLYNCKRGELTKSGVFGEGSTLYPASKMGKVLICIGNKLG